MCVVIADRAVDLAGEFHRGDLPALALQAEKAFPGGPPVMNELAIVSTDHCPFCMKDQKELGLGNFAAIPNGIGGVEHRMELIYQGVVAGELSLERWVETCCTTPARMFGMYPKKGVIAPGADADVVVWDPNQKTKIGINDKHHMNMDHSAWEGFVIDGHVDTVLSRGKVVIDDNAYLGTMSDTYLGKAANKNALYGQIPTAYAGIEGAVGRAFGVPSAGGATPTSPLKRLIIALAGDLLLSITTILVVSRTDVTRRRSM